MILPFSTKINGKPTYFVEKIWEAFFQKGIQFNAVEMNIGIEVLPKGYVIKTHRPKLHSIREDKNNRWKPSVMIDFFINARQKNMFRFAPRIPVVSTQKIEIFQNSKTWIRDGFVIPAVYIDGYTMSYDVIESLSKNDGFDSLEEFFEYFNKDFSGKIIHWTDLKY